MGREKRILYIQYANPACYPSLEHSSRILADRGWRALFLGTGSLGESDILKLADHPNISHIRLGYYKGGWKQKFHYAWFFFRSIMTALRQRSRWVYASDPLSCPPALLLSYAPGIKVVYHEHDFPGTAYRSKFMRAILLFRRWTAVRAAACVLPGEKRRHIFESETHVSKKAVSVLNCPLKEEISPEKPPAAGKGFSIVYHGTIVPNRIPVSVLEAMAILPDYVKIKIIGFETAGHYGYLEELKKTARRLGIINRVEIRGALPFRKDVLDECRGCDIGLALVPTKSDDINEQNMAGASNKAFDYMACGLALLVSDLSDWRDMYIGPGYGRACNPDSPDNIASALRWFIENPAETLSMGEKGRRRIMKEWNYENQFASVSGLIESRA